MPIYEYECVACKAIWEAIRPIPMAKEPVDCPCGGKAEKITSVPAPAQFQGDGWTPIYHPGPQEK